jgi:hypothetical protein
MSRRPTRPVTLQLSWICLSQLGGGHEKIYMNVVTVFG